jgi:hypothetical protein
LGGSGSRSDGYSEIVRDVAVDSSGAVYVTGGTRSPDLPGVDPSRSHHVGGDDAFVAKLDPSGSVVFSTYLGGTNADRAYAIALDGTGNIYITGVTYFAATGDEFPTTANAAQRTQGLETVFITKLDANGGIIYSTLLGGRGDQTGWGIAVDLDGNAYVAGETNSVDFPIQTPYQANLAGSPSQGFYQSEEEDAFLTKVSSDGSQFIYSTYVGGSGVDRASGVAVGSDGTAYLTGFTESTDFPINGAMQGTLRGERDAFVTRVNSDGTGLEYSTYLGGSRVDVGAAITVDPAGASWVTGSTESDDFPVENAFQARRSGTDRPEERFRDAFLVSLSPAGSSLKYGTYLGGRLRDAGVALALDRAGNVYLTGQTFSIDFPAVGSDPPADERFGDGFLVKVDSQSRRVLFSMSFGGRLADDPFSIAVGETGTTYIGGATASPDLPLANNGRRGVDDGFVAKFASQPNGSGTAAVAGPHAWADIVGRQRIRSGRAQSLTVFFGNSGTKDALGVPLWIDGIPRDASWALGLDVLPPRAPIGGEEVYLKRFPVEVDKGASAVLPLFLPLIPAGATGSFVLTLTVPSDREFTLHVWTDPPYFGSALSDAVAGCLTAVFVDIFTEDILPAGIPFPVRCQNMVRDIALDWFERMPDSFFSPPDQQRPSIYSNVAFIAAIIETGVTCALQVAGELQPAWQIGELVAATLTVMEDLADRSEKIATCVEEFTKGRGSVPGGGHYGSSSPEVEWPMESSSSVDPNDKTGSAGTGAERFVATSNGLRYVISFENLASATAPAQVVVVKDRLDASKVDLATLSVGPITIGGQQFIPPPGATDFRQIIGLETDLTLAVDIDVRLDRASGDVTWRLSTVDRQTGQTPSDPLAGFLPPNKLPPEGDGSVSFSVRPRGALASGTEVRNGASITFDENPPILAPEWVNAIDDDEPSSEVRSAREEGTGRLRVRWTGVDRGSGIASYTIFVSENGGPFRVWLTSTSQEAIFTEARGASYEFYSVAMDRAGNVEARPTAGVRATFRSADPASSWWWWVVVVVVLLFGSVAAVWRFLTQRRH